MARVLLISDDGEMLTPLADSLISAGHSVVTTQRAEDGLAAAFRIQPHLAVVETDLTDLRALEVIATLHRELPQTASVLVTGRGTYDIAVAALRAGATWLASKPLLLQELLRVIDICSVRDCGISNPALVTRTGVRGSDVELHSVARWTALVVALLDSPTDPRTLNEWGRIVAVSTGGLRNWCYTAGLSARRSLLFARLLRAVWIGVRCQRRPEDLLDIVDRRTVTKVLRLASGGKERLPETVEEFLQCQQILPDRRATDCVRSALRRRSLSTRDAHDGLGKDGPAQPAGAARSQSERRI